MSAASHAERIFRRVQNLFQVGSSTTAALDDGNAQTVQIKTAGAVTRDKVSLLYSFGFSSSPPIGSDLVVLNVAGDSSNGLVIATGHKASRQRGLTPGQVVVYDAAGSTILLDGKGGIVITPKAGTTTFNGAVVITGDATIGGVHFLEHDHGNVQNGNGVTGPPANP